MLIWQDCDKPGHEEGCYVAITSTGQKLYDCEEN